MSATYLALVNPAAGGGRCGKLVDQALQQLIDAGLSIDVYPTSKAREATDVVRRAYAEGQRRFIAVGGDGTVHEVVNGLFPEARAERPRLGLLPLGTGNSFLRDFAQDGLAHATAALAEDRHRCCDVIRLTHADGELYYLNLLSLGFSADVATTTNRWFKPLGEMGYMFGVLARLISLRARVFPWRTAPGTFDCTPALLLTCSNSRYTGGKMLIAPQADSTNGLIEVIRVGRMGRLRLMRHFKKLYDGTYVDLPETTRTAVTQIEFDLPGPLPVMIDGEVLNLHCHKLEIMPGALEVAV